MAAKVIHLAERIQRRWAERADKQGDAGEALPGRKHHVTCKCPRCGAYHDAAMHWTGRGTPRLFCPVCRSRVAGLSNAPLSQVNKIMSRNTRRGAYPGHE